MKTSLENLYVHIGHSWVPGVSRGFYFWQPAPRLNNAPMAGATAQTSHEPPQKLKRTGTHHTEEYQWRKNRREWRRVWRK